METCPEQPWSLESLNPFQPITLVNKGNCDLVPCFSACNIRTNTFAFIDFPICEQSLLTMAGYVNSVEMTNSTSSYPYIPPAFLNFTSLVRLKLDPVNCTCVLAKYFYNFVQKVVLDASCTDGDLTAIVYIYGNYDVCSNVTDTLPEYDSAPCKQFCTSMPECAKGSTSE